MFKVVFRPMLAVDWDPALLKFPKIAMPKIDGVRCLVNDYGKVLGRSLKPHANKHLRVMFGGYDFDEGSDFAGLDGEITLGSDPTANDLCRLTTSAITTIDSKPDFHWWIFDRYKVGTTYVDRLLAAQEQVARLNHPNIHMVPHVIVSNMEELLAFEADCLAKGFEGVILRDPDAKYKYGRSTVKSGGYLRIKRFIEEDAIVTELIEGQMNANPATVNELGYTERSTHQLNMVPNGMIGTLVCTVVKEVVLDGKIYFKPGDVIRVAPGKMSNVEAKDYFEHPDMILGRTIRFKFFPKGMKDKPRFPTFQCFRADTDMVRG